MGLMLISIKNYYEQLVHERMRAIAEKSSDFDDPDFTDDVACVALNNLPVRYARHSVDLSFHMTDEEWHAAVKQVEDAVAEAMKFVKRRQGERPISTEYS